MTKKLLTLTLSLYTCVTPCFAAQLGPKENNSHSTTVLVSNPPPPSVTEEWNNLVNIRLENQDNESLTAVKNFGDKHIAEYPSLLNTVIKKSKLKGTAMCAVCEKADINFLKVILKWREELKVLEYKQVSKNRDKKEYKKILSPELKYKMTLLYISCYFGALNSEKNTLEILQLLLAHEEVLDVLNKENSKKKIALEVCCKWKRYEMAKELIAAYNKNNIAIPAEKLQILKENALKSKDDDLLEILSKYKKPE